MWFSAPAGDIGSAGGGGGVGAAPVAGGGACAVGPAIPPIAAAPNAVAVAGAAGAIVPVVSPVPALNLPNLPCPRRPDIGHEGRHITLRANHFQISMPRGHVHHYEVLIQPDKCPRKVRIMPQGLNSSCIFIVCISKEIIYSNGIARPFNLSNNIFA